MEKGKSFLTRWAGMTGTLFPIRGPVLYLINRDKFSHQGKFLATKSIILPQDSTGWA